MIRNNFVYLTDVAMKLEMSAIDIIKQAENGTVTLYFENSERDLSIVFSLGKIDSYIDNDGHEQRTICPESHFTKQVSLGEKIKLNAFALKALRLNGHFLLKDVDCSPLADVAVTEDVGVSWYFEPPSASNKQYHNSHIIMIEEDLQRLSLHHVPASLQSKVEQKLHKARQISATHPEAFNDSMSRHQIWIALSSINPINFTHGETEFWKAHRALEDKIFHTLSRGRPKGK